MLSVEQALERILGAMTPLPAEQVSVADGLGRVLAKDIVARRTQPPAAMSAMDGYAVRARDVASVPATIERTPRATISSRRSGAMVPIPPIMIPRLPGFAKPHMA